MAGLQLETKRRASGIRYWLLGMASVALLGVLGWIVFVWYMTGVRPDFLPFPSTVLADSRVDETRVTLEQIDEYTVDNNYPRYITIPALSIERARIQQVGLEGGMIGRSTSLDDVAWYKESATPGQGYGTVIIDGHSNGISRNGAFAGLDGLSEGDDIIVERGDGRAFTYTVTENKTESFISARKTGIKRLFTPYDKTKEGLGLLTYTGNWIPRDQVFDQSVLVRAVAK